MRIRNILFSIAVTVVLAAAGVADAGAQQKLALVIGIGDYHSPDAPQQWIRAGEYLHAGQ